MLQVHTCVFLLCEMCVITHKNRPCGFDNCILVLSLRPWIIDLIDFKTGSYVIEFRSTTGQIINFSGFK